MNSKWLNHSHSIRTSLARRKFLHRLLLRKNRFFVEQHPEKITVLTSSSRVSTVIYLVYPLNLHLLSPLTPIQTNFSNILP